MILIFKRLIPYMYERLSFGIWGDCLKNSDMSSIPTERRSFRHVGWQWYVRYHTGVYHAPTKIFSTLDMRILHIGYKYYI